MKEILSSTLIAALVSAIVTFMTARKKTSVEYVTSDRRKWREEIREIAEALDGANYANTLKQLNRLKVRINAYGEHVLKKVRCDSHIWDLIHEIEENRPLGEELRKKQQQMIQYLSLMLKYDWERSKNEVKGDAYSVCGWFLIAISLIGFSLNGIVLGENVLRGEDGKNYIIMSLWIALIILVITVLLKWFLNRIIDSGSTYDGSFLKLLGCWGLEGTVAIILFVLFGGCDRLLKTEFEEVESMAIVQEIRAICYTIYIAGVFVLMIRNMEKEQQEYYLGEAVGEIRDAGQEKRKMGKLIQKKEIISKKIIWGGVLVLIILTACAYTLQIPDVNAFLMQHSVTAPICLKANIIDSGIIEILLETEITLLIGAVTTLALIVTFLQTRYLGANYKYWFFKKRIYKLLPQEMIIIMLFAIAGTGIAYVFENGIIGLLCYGVIWWMFICLLCRVYVAVIKVSRMFEKLDKKLCNGELSERKEWCDSVYKKLYNSEENHGKHNSYFYEEAGIIFSMIEVYADYCEKSTDHEVKKELENRIVKLFLILMDKVGSEAEVISARPWTGSKEEEELKLEKELIEKNEKFQKAVGEKKIAEVEKYIRKKI